jgi:hypothetical protein
MTTHPFQSRSVVPLLLSALLLSGCTSEHTVTTPAGLPPARDVARSSTTFTVGPLVISGIESSFPGDRWHFRDATLSGPVTGDLTGTANVTLNSNLDMFAGSGPVWGTMQIVTTSGDVWQTTLTGTFVTGLPQLAIQLFSHMVLHGPDQQTLSVECDETTATSETLVCTGSGLSPHP